MKITQNSVSRNQRSGFTLIEVLVTITIIATISALSLPLAPALFRSNRVDQGLLSIVGTMEQARQHAVAHNTYVWVAFMPAPAAKPESGVSMVVFESRGGIDSLNWDTNPVALKGHADLVAIGPVRSLPGTQITDSGALTVANLPTVAATPSNLQTVQVLMPYAAGGNLTFTRALLFTPDGRATVKNYTSQIELGLKQSIGDTSATTSTAKTNVAVLRLGSLTGKLKVYRPV